MMINVIMVPVPKIEREQKYKTIAIVLASVYITIFILLYVAILSIRAKTVHINKDALLVFQNGQSIPGESLYYADSWIDTPAYLITNIPENEEYIRLSWKYVDTGERNLRYHRCDVETNISISDNYGPLLLNQFLPLLFRKNNYLQANNLDQNNCLLNFLGSYDMTMKYEIYKIDYAEFTKQYFVHGQSFFWTLYNAEETKYVVVPESLNKDRIKISILVNLFNDRIIRFIHNRTDRNLVVKPHTMISNCLKERSGA